MSAEADACPPLTRAGLSDPRLEIRGIARMYGTGPLRKLALHAVSFTLARGEVAAVCGPSGSGKTTLLNLIGTLDRPDTGEIWLDGAPLHHMPPAEREVARRRDIGFVFQDFGLLPHLTAQENVEMALLMDAEPRAARRGRARAALSKVGLQDEGPHFPHELSGGEKQRVSVARALVKRPKLVLADEPTASLDSESGRALVALIGALARCEGTTFVIATHDARVLEAATRRFTLRDGILTDESLA